ncbi:MAG: hypothetical protein ACP6IU_14590 [Candidatus Asgardarchaeia archaeon]
MLQKSNVFILSLFLFIIFIFPISTTFNSRIIVSSSLLWFKKGVYVEFRDTSDYADIMFFNGSGISFDHGTCVFRWVCLEFNDSSDIAKLEVTLSIISYNEVKFKVTTQILININTRDVFLTDGTECGKTTLWLPTNLREGDTVVFGYPKTAIEGIVTEKGYVIKTPYGYQEAFEVEFNSKNPVNVTYQNKTYSYRLWNWLDYDSDIGILIQSANFIGEGALYALGIFKIYMAMLIYKTNIDLGPEKLLPVIIDTIWLISPIIFFTMVFILVYWSRKKKKYRMRRVKRYRKH